MTVAESLLAENHSCPLLFSLIFPFLQSPWFSFFFFSFSYCSFSPWSFFLLQHTCFSLSVMPSTIIPLLIKKKARKKIVKQTNRDHSQEICNLTWEERKRMWKRKDAGEVGFVSCSFMNHSLFFSQGIS